MNDRKFVGCEHKVFALDDIVAVSHNQTSISVYLRGGHELKLGTSGEATQLWEFFSKRGKIISAYKTELPDDSEF